MKKLLFIIALGLSVVVNAQNYDNQKVISIAMSDDEYPFVDHEGAMTFIPAGRYADRIIMTARNCTEVTELQAMQSRNRESLQRFWAKHKNDALEMRESIEKIAVGLAKAVK